MFLKKIKIQTPLGEMLAVAHDDALVLLEFTDNENLERDLSQIEEHFENKIKDGENLILKQIEAEISEYFRHPFANFSTPLEMIGTDFQKEVWSEIAKISAGNITSYSEIAEKINNPNAAMAVGNALNANKISIVVPCHRVLTKDLKIGGYNGGEARKNWLLQHEIF